MMKKCKCPSVISTSETRRNLFRTQHLRKRFLPLVEMTKTLRCGRRPRRATMRLGLETGRSSLLGFVVLLALLLAACSSNTAVSTPNPDVTEIAVTEIELDGNITNANAELSGLGWYGDTLILLPQYPDFSGEETAVYAIPKATIAAYLDGTATDPITPISIPVIVDDLSDVISRPEGYEAIDFIGDDAYLTIEASGGGNARLPHQRCAGPRFVSADVGCE